MSEEKNFIKIYKSTEEMTNRMHRGEVQINNLENTFKENL